MDSLLLAFTFAAAAHAGFQFNPLGLRFNKPSQLLFHAGQAAFKSSSCQPGKSLQATEINSATRLS